MWNFLKFFGLFWNFLESFAILFWNFSEFVWNFFGNPVYRKLGDFTTHQEMMWTNQAKVWRRDHAITAITLLESHNVDEPLTESWQNFFERSPPSKMPIFYMQVKTHTRKSIHENSWPSSPITALTSCFTTPPSIILSTLGKFVLRFDASEDAKNTPLADTLHFVQPIHNWKKLGGWGPQSVCLDLL